MTRSLVFGLALALIGLTAPRAQMRVVPIDDQQGHTALGLALRHLGNIGIFLMATAHPDDENNGLLVMLNRGQGYRTAIAAATRGNGGQNEIGPELFEPLGVLRTEELAAMHRFDGAEQYFAREAPGLDDKMVKTFKDHNVEVVTLSPAEYDQWVDVARKSSYAEFAKEVPSGKKLIEEALSVK